MKLLFLLPIFKNTGPANVVAALLKQLLKRKANDDINCALFLVSFYPAQDNYQAKFTRNQVTLIELDGFNIKSLYRLWCLIRKEKIDVVHSHCLLPDIANAFISLFTSAKTVSSVHCNINDNYKNEYRFPKGPLYYWLHRLSLLSIKQVVSVSSSAQLNHHTPIIYNGIGKRTLAPEPSSSLNLVFAGRLITSKNISFLLQSFDYLLAQTAAKNGAIKLHIFGDGELYSSIKALNHAHIILHGFVDDYLAHLPDNSIVVNPSLFEGMPMAVVEALSSNVPVVLSTISAHQEIAKHIQHGVKLYNNTEAGFTQAVKSLIDENNKVCFDKTLMAEQFEKEFSDTVMVERYFKVYRS